MVMKGLTIQCTYVHGDEVHSTKLMRTFAIIYVPILVGVMSHFLGTVARVIMDVQRNSMLRHIQNRELRPTDLKDTWILTVTAS